jgi:phosphatidylserine/phosphatidylglycerophosphate/cardiolipin synthase-like enzyme
VRANEVFRLQRWRSSSCCGGACEWTPQAARIATGRGTYWYRKSERYLGGVNRAGASRLRDDHAVELLRAVAEGRKLQAIIQSSLDLVVTGPDIDAGARDTGVVVEQLFCEARYSVLVVGFAIYKGSVIFRRLAERLDASPDINVKLCLDVSRRGTDTTRDDELTARYARRFVEDEWPGKRLPNLYFDPRGLTADGAARAVLHAKCIVIDQRVALVTSANPTPAAYERNIEVGLIVRQGDIPGRIHRHFESLIGEGHLKRLTLPSQ